MNFKERVFRKESLARYLDSDKKFSKQLGAFDLSSLQWSVRLRPCATLNFLLLCRLRVLHILLGTLFSARLSVGFWDGP